jgi:broad specificity phosphatase PhoE
LVRHGVTAWNAAGRFQGQSDVVLCGEGVAQARAIASRLSAEAVDRLYSSDLKRSYDTARIVAAALDAPVVSDPRLREFAFGQWEGLTWAEIVAARPHLRDLTVTDAQRYRPEGGETFAHVTARVRSFLDEVAREGDDHVVVVTHAGPIHAMLDLLGVFAREDREDAFAYAIAPGSLTRIAMEPDGARLIILSDVEHLNSTR